MDAQEKAAQIEKTIKEVEGEPLTEIEEFRILSGKGIEFPLLNGEMLYIPPLSMSQYDCLLDLEQLDKLTDAKEVINKRVEIVAKVVNRKAEELKELICKTDIEDILQLALYSGLAGRSIFKKKVLKISEVQEMILSLRRQITPK